MLFSIQKCPILASVIIVIIAFCLHEFLSKRKIETNILIIEFENFENNLFETVENLCHVFSTVNIFSKLFIYPSIDFSSLTSKCQINLIEKHKSPFTSYVNLNLQTSIRSSFLLVIPDSVRVDNISHFTQQWPKYEKLLQETNNDALLFPVYTPIGNAPNVSCEYFSFDVKRWTLNYLTEGDFCEYHSEHGFVVLTKVESFFSLHQPLSLPFLRSFLIQSQISNLSIRLIHQKLFIKEKKLFLSERLLAKHLQLEAYRTNRLFQDIGIKKINYVNNSSESFGCTRLTQRCFGTIINDIPEYLTQGRWLPPCCRANLEITGRYVIDLLTKSGIRYWLEGGSLLGAARDGSIIDWDYDIDLGVYREDLIKLSFLKTFLSNNSHFRFEDGQGFLWEKAFNGDFLSVSYSRTNRVHVDIFPFFAINGTMTKETWFANHPQDMPFEEKYLKPLTNINFIGIEVKAPNNVRQFLEMKFGNGAIENPKYPGQIELK